MMVEMDKDENTHRVRKWSVAKGIDEGEVSFKGRQYEERQKKHELGATNSDVHMSDPSSGNTAMRGTKKRHDDEQGREEGNRSKTSSDDSNSVRGTVRTQTTTNRRRNQGAEDQVPQPM